MVINFQAVLYCKWYNIKPGMREKREVLNVSKQDIVALLRAAELEQNVSNRRRLFRLYQQKQKTCNCYNPVRYFASTLP